MQPFTQTGATAAAPCPAQPFIPAPIWGSMPVKPDQEWWRNEQVINPRKDFIEDLIGMPEKNFRNAYHWSIQNPFSPEKTALANAKPWILKFTDPDGQYRRAAIFHSTFALMSVQELKLPTPSGKPRPYFSILVSDPWAPWEADIRYLQSFKENKNALFQIASTPFGPLEGGMAMQSAYLENMLPHAVQGEEACVATASAAFWRKYCMGEPHYLLKNLSDKLPMHGHFTADSRHKVSIDKKALEDYAYNPDDIQKVCIGLHTDVVVTSGYGQENAGQEKGNGAQQRLPVCTAPDGHIDTNRTQVIHQLFTFALNVGNLDKKSQHIQDAAQMLLNACYEGTIKAAAHAKKSRLFLTLVGAGAFGNNMQWLASALGRNECVDTIKHYGLQVTLIFHPDKVRTPPHRSAKTDLIFFEEMLKIYDSVNNTQLSKDSRLHATISNYLITAYDKSSSPDTLHEYAQAINQQLMGPAREAGIAARNTPAPLSPAASRPAPSQAFQEPKTIPTPQEQAYGTLSNVDILWEATVSGPRSPKPEAHILVGRKGKYAFGITEADTTISLKNPEEARISQEPPVYFVKKDNDKKPDDREYRWINLRELLQTLETREKTTAALTQGNFKNISIRSRGGAPTLIDERLVKILWENREKLNK